MATWSDLKFKLITTGDETGSWGDTTNSNIGNAIEQAITGSENVTFTDANIVLTLTDTTELQTARALRLSLTGTTTTTRNLTVPAIQKFYIIDNELPNNITVKNPTGAETFTVPAGTSALIFSTGLGVVSAITYFAGAITSFLAVITGGTIDDTPIGSDTPSTGAFTTIESTSLTLTSPLAVTSGGTGVTSSTGTGDVVLSDAPTILDPDLTGTPTAPTAVAGTSTTQIATTAFVHAVIPSGGIIMWSGSVSTIPSGWYLCDGNNGTPNLLNKFIVGAGSTYAVAATGGSADATLVSHNHTASTNTATLLGSATGVSETWNTGGAATGIFSKVTGFPTPGTPSGTDTSNSGQLNIDASHSHTVTVASAGTSATNANLPPYYALAYIMKG